MKSIITATLACMATLLVGCNYLIQDYDVDTNPYGVRNRTLLEHFENNYDKSCTMYCKAIRMAGLVEVIEAGGVTCVVPNNTAFSSLLGMMDVTSLEEVDPIVLRALLLYLIFPGDYRALTMTPNESYRIESLSGDPIFIERNPSSSDKYRVVINRSGELGGSPITVLQQDYVFKNQTVAQVVPEFIAFKPKVALTDERPENFEYPSSVPTATLIVSDDTSIYGSSAYRDSNYNGNAEGTRVSGRSSATRYGIFKFPLLPISFKETIASAMLVTRVFNVSTYTVEEECILQFRELNYSGWLETNATWNSIRGSYATPIDRAPVIMGSANFLVPTNLATTPVNLRCDITSSILKYYSRDSTHISVLIEDISTNRNASNAQLYLSDKEVKGYYSTIEVTGLFFSAMTLVRNNPIVLSGSSTALNPDNHFAMAGPVVPDGYHYTDANIIYKVKSVPAGGILTLYGVPMPVDARFTQAEMKAGMVKYLSTTGGSDNFELRVFDYLGGQYMNDLTITIVN